MCFFLGEGGWFAGWLVGRRRMIAMIDTTREADDERTDLMGKGESVNSSSADDP